jgi:hypothetical protein
MKLGGEGAEDPGHHDAVQSSTIDGWIDDIGEDVAIEGIATKHEVEPPLVVGCRGLQNNHDHRSYVLEVGSLRMLVCSEGGIGVGGGVDGAIVIVILGKRDPLGNGALLFQVMSDDFLLLPSEGGGVIARPSLV